MFYYFYRFLLSSCVCQLLIKFMMMMMMMMSSMLQLKRTAARKNAEINIINRMIMNSTVVIWKPNERIISAVVSALASLSCPQLSVNYYCAVLAYCGQWRLTEILTDNDLSDICSHKHCTFSGSDKRADLQQSEFLALSFSKPRL